MALTPGARLGAYEITAQIGVGGMGEVWCAVDTNLGRQVAIKVLPDSFAHDPERLARFEREAKTLASLNHPNIAQIHGLEKSDGTTALVMELVDGPTLADRIAQGPIPIDEALPIAKQIAEALEAAHERGIIHRDLKPANVKVKDDGTVKVLDFGLAKAMEPAGAMSPGLSESPTLTTPAMTQPGIILGTAAYMSPEQARGKSVDKRTDIWSFGCVLFEMLSGKRAFRGDDVTDTIAAVVRGEPLWDALPKDVPVRLMQVLRSCLRKDPTKRVRDAGDVVLALEGAFEGPPVPTLGDAAAVVPRAWRQVLPWGLGAVLVGSVVTALAMRIVMRPGADPPVRLSIPVPPDLDPCCPAITPDGRTVAFHGLNSPPPRTQVFLRRLDQLEIVSVQGSERNPETFPEFFSPDGEWLLVRGRNWAQPSAIDGWSGGADCQGQRRLWCDLGTGRRDRV